MNQIDLASTWFPVELDEPRCGFPRFNVSCRNNSAPVLSLPDGDYNIRSIFYQNQSFLVSRADRDAVCSHSIQNISLPDDRFYLPKSQREMVLLFDCNLTTRGMEEFSQDMVDCGSGNRSNTTLALWNGDKDLGFVSGNCTKSVLAPVAFTDGMENVEDVVNRGFVLNWIASDCSVCGGTGGKCGFDYTSYHFKCFCPDRPHTARCPPGPGKKGMRLKLGLGLASSIVGMVVLIILSFRFIKEFPLMRRGENKKIEVFLKDHEFLSPKRYRYSDIKKITSSFRVKLGKGGYGDVYKGKLHDGRHVAVKILNKSKSNGEDFINEVASISRTSHVNIVTLLGFCIERRHRALVYEFMPNGSLEKFIFRENTDYHRLEWEKLYRIAVGIARGLDYLHRGCNTRILHFDIKPHNILLDDEFCPKISDFGLARSCQGNESFVSMTGARGTIGYIAPEVFSRNFGRVSHKSDVYSYGMMILEMVGGRKNINVEVDRTSEIYFPDYIYSRIELEGEVGLEGIRNEDEQEKARKMIIVSLWCIQTDPSNRPSMSRVVEMLEGNIGSLTIPPKPFLSSSPSRAAATNCSSTLVF
ncbi:hypothetical protein V6N12_030307 [Hibiscus sabdariffa]|uniref:non-specific serine/threonine protein kinase n=1 Tax=Hibiscus sabdariffa TaxID=183260 RepID=A0ABR2C0L2_9ROSI